MRAGRIALSPLPRIADGLPQGSRVPTSGPDEPFAVETFLAAAGGRVAAAPVHTSCVEDDLVLVNARLVQYPNRTIRRCR